MTSRIRNVCGLALYATSIWIFLILFGSVVLFALFLISPWMLLVVTGSIASTYAYGRGHRWRAFVHLRLWHWIRTYYFAYELQGEPEGLAMLMNPDDLALPVLWALYPHGSYPITPAFYWALNPRFYQTTRTVVHSLVFYVPVMRTLMHWAGAIDSDESTIRHSLERGRSVCICPGGVSDIARTGQVVRKRMGFLRVARDTGVCVVPVWCPDERSYYDHWLPLGNRLEDILGFPFPIFILGRWWCFLIPKAFERSRIRVGAPIDVKQYSSLEEASDVFWSSMQRLQRGQMSSPPVTITQEGD